MRTIRVTFVITEDEEKQLRVSHREYEANHDTHISVSEYIRRTLFPSTKPTSELPSEPTNKFSFDKIS